MQDLKAKFTISQPKCNAKFSVTSQPKYDYKVTINGYPMDYIDSIIGEGNLEIEQNGKEVTIKNITYVHTQALAAESWEINHNLNKKPAAFFVDSADSVVVPDKIIYNDENTITAIFLASFAGKAYLN